MTFAERNQGVTAEEKLVLHTDLTITWCQGTVAVACTQTRQVRSTPLSTALQRVFVTSDEKTTQVKSGKKLKMPACGGRDVNWCWAYMCIFNPDLGQKF